MNDTMTTAAIEADPTVPIIRVTRWRRSASKTSATAAPGCAQSLCDSFEGRDAWLRSGMDVGVDQGYAKMDALLAAGEIAGTAEGAEA